MRKDKIKCQICGWEGHVLPVHLQENGCATVEEYTKQFPDAPLFSKVAQEIIEKKKKQNIAKEKIDANKLFGIKLFTNQVLIDRYINPFPTTPAIDEYYVFNKENTALICYAIINQGENVYISGATGTGKSTLVEQVVARLNRPFTRVNMDAQITRSDFVGQWVLKGQEMDFQYGLLPIAMKEGHILLIDEYDAMSAEIALVLQNVLDSGKLTITETSETITAHPEFRVFATGNTKGLGDETGLYHGTQPQNYANLNRFSIVLEVDYLSPEQERKIVELKTGIENQDTISKLVETANLIRNAHKKGDVYSVISTRNIINIGKKIKDFCDVKLAFNIGFLNLLPEQDKSVVKEIIQRVWAI